MISSCVVCTGPGKALLYIYISFQKMAAKNQCSSKCVFIVLLFIIICSIITLHQQNLLQDFSGFQSSNMTRDFQTLYESIWNQTQNRLNLLPYRRPTEDYQLGTFNTATTKEVEPMNQTTVHGVWYHEAYPQNYHFLIDEPETCQRENPFLVLMVPVAPKEIKARHAIRSTWGNESVVQGKSISVLFLLGLHGGAEAEKMQGAIRTESKQQRDLIQSSFLDSYKNLTIKTMVMLDWLATRCPQASYAMKIDSDMFLNLENLMSLLLAPNTPRQNYITGVVMSKSMVVRNVKSKWYVSKEDHPEDYYTVYLMGMGYVFSNDLPKRLVSISKSIKPFSIEDAYVGKCLKNLGVSPSKPPEPDRFKTYHSGPFSHKKFAYVITTILGSPEKLVTYWQNLKNPEKLEEV